VALHRHPGVPQTFHCVDKLPGRRSPSAASCAFTFAICRSKSFSLEMVIV
jgi:hypothetical protein